MNYQRPHKENKGWRVYFSAVSPFQHCNYSLTAPSKVPQSKGWGAADSAELQQEQASALLHRHISRCGRCGWPEAWWIYSLQGTGNKINWGCRLLCVLNLRVGFLAFAAPACRGRAAQFLCVPWNLLNTISGLCLTVIFPLRILWISMAAGQMQISPHDWKK